jgi:3'-phosphoadenosine 5'-phosphosulfate sulfotransferase (PAPS reductase)/FAD synthetase
VTWDLRRGLVKLAPIAAWTDTDVEAYAADHPDLIGNPLPQLATARWGVEPCTRRVGTDQDPGRSLGRAGQDRVRTAPVTGTGARAVTAEPPSRKPPPRRGQSSRTRRVRSSLALFPSSSVTVNVIWKLPA